jgi:hypothetical protein
LESGPLKIIVQRNLTQPTPSPNRLIKGGRCRFPMGRGTNFTRDSRASSLNIRYPISNVLSFSDLENL